jgi:hypothetical protein
LQEQLLTDQLIKETKMPDDPILTAFVEQFSKKKPSLLSQQGGAKVKIMKKKNGKKTFRK